MGDQNITSDKKEASEKKENRDLNDLGAGMFGFMIGWITYSTFHSEKEHSVNEIAVIVGVLGGATVIRAFSKTETQFAFYCMGLALGYLGHALLRWVIRR